MLTFIDFLEKINAPHLTTESNILYNPLRSLDPDSVDVGMPLTEAQFTRDKLDKVTKLLIYNEILKFEIQVNVLYYRKFWKICFEMRVWKRILKYVLFI